MRFIVDAQLPPVLAAWLSTKGMEAASVSDVGLRDADDSEIWDWAVASKAVIVTKDQGFALRRAASKTGLCILWLRLGNTVNRVLLLRLSESWPSIEQHLRDGRTVVEVR